jgi:hypothetical protein
MMIGETPQPIIDVSLPPLRPGLADALRPLLEAHGARIEERVSDCMVRFPAGTVMQRTWPFVETMRYNMRLPDGYIVLYEVGRDGRTNLCFDPRDLPPEVLERFA